MVAVSQALWSRAVSQPAVKERNASNPTTRGARARSPELAASANVGGDSRAGRGQQKRETELTGVLPRHSSRVSPSLKHLIMSSITSSLRTTPKACMGRAAGGLAGVSSWRPVSGMARFGILSNLGLVGSQRREGGGPRSWESSRGSGGVGAVVLVEEEHLRLRLETGGSLHLGRQTNNQELKARRQQWLTWGECSLVTWLGHCGHSIRSPGTRAGASKQASEQTSRWTGRRGQTGAEAIMGAPRQASTRGMGERAEAEQSTRGGRGRTEDVSQYCVLAGLLRRLGRGERRKSSGGDGVQHSGIGSLGKAGPAREVLYGGTKGKYLLWCTQ